MDKWKLIKAILGITAGIIAIYLCVIWFGWKLLLVISLFNFSKNVALSDKYIEK